MNFRLLKYFLTVAEEKNISRAAKKLYISQQTLSSAMQRLESTYHTKLFERQPHIHLTEAGYFVAQFARDVMSRENQLTNQLAAISVSECGHLNIGVTPVRARLLLPEFLPLFQAKHPGIELSVRVDTYRTMEEWLAQGDLDLMLTMYRPNVSSGKQISLYRDPFCLLVPRPMADRYFSSGELSGITTVREEDCPGDKVKALLQNEDFIQMTRSTIKTNSDELLWEKGIKPHILYSFHDLDTVLELSLKGMGYCFSYLQYAEKIASQRIESSSEGPVFITFSKWSSEVFLFVAHQADKNRAAAIFAAELRGFCLQRDKHSMRKLR